MKGHQSGLAKLGASNRQNTFSEVNIFTLQVEGLTDAQAGYRQQSKETVVGSTSQTMSRR
jgi:hypothetical protein